MTNKRGFAAKLKRLPTGGVAPMLTRGFPPNSLKKLRRRDKSIRRFFAKRISRLRGKKRNTAAIVYNTAQNIPLLRDKQTVGYEKTGKKIDALIAGNKALRDQLIVDNKLFQRNMRLKNDALIEQVRSMGRREKQFQTFSKPEIVRPSLPLIAPVETLSKNLKRPLPVIEPAEKTNFLVPIGVGLAALLMLKG